MIALIIDAHTHYGIGLNFPFRAKTIDDMVIVMDKYGVDMACISSAYALLHDCPEGNRRLYEAVKLYPSRFIPFCAVNPRYLDEAKNELRKYINEKGWKGVKLHPELHYYMANCEASIAIMEEIDKLNVPVLIHSGDPHMYGFYSRLDLIAELAGMYPETPIILGHMGITAWLDAIELAKKHLNLLLDTSGSCYSYGMVELAVEELGAERVVFGSDFAELNLPVELSKVMDSDISDGAKNLVLGGNIARIICLKEGK